jgi:hypothetical protein
MVKAPAHISIENLWLSFYSWTAHVGSLVAGINSGDHRS